MNRAKFPYNPTAYQVLGVEASASEKEMRRAYRRAARKMHPDAGGSATDFDVLTRAWGLVHNAQARADYDEQLREVNRRYSTTSQPASTARSNRFRSPARSGQNTSKPTLDIYPPLSEGPLEVRTVNGRGKSVSVLVDARLTSQRVIGEQRLPSAFVEVEEELIQRLIPSLPALRVVHGIRLKTGRFSAAHITTLFLAGNRAAVIQYLRVPPDSYRFTGTELQAKKLIRLPDVTKQLVALAQANPCIDAGGFVVATSADGNVHAPEIEAPLNLTGSLGYTVAPTSLFDAVRELKFFFGTGDTPHRVDREILGALTAKTSERK